ncbi:MAG: hypothetical protein HYZ38_23815 [Mycobacterium sp.]|nr:hypothetical protein [Mycobacterium sp.]
MTRTTMLLLAAGLTVGSIAIAPIAGAEICTGPAGARYTEGQCADIPEDQTAGTAIESSPLPYTFGEVPCFTQEGIAYYTPPGQPC